MEIANEYIKLSKSEIYVAKTYEKPIVQIWFRDESFDIFKKAVEKSNQLGLFYYKKDKSPILEPYVIVPRDSLYSQLYSIERHLSAIISVNLSEPLTKDIIKVRDNLRTFMRQIGYKHPF